MCPRIPTDPIAQAGVRPGWRLVAIGSGEAGEADAADADAAEWQSRLKAVGPGECLGHG